jgi:hypothetical protein
MPEDSRTLGAIDWRSTFPFTHLFRSFRIAAHPSKMVTALALLLLLYIGGRVLDSIWHYTSYIFRRGDVAAMYDDPRILPVSNNRIATEEERVGPFVGFFAYESSQVNYLSQAVLQNQWLDADGVFVHAADFLVTGPRIAFANSPVFFTLFTLWFLLIWSIFGGAIARIAAIHIARDEKLSIRQALRFSTGKLLSFIFAPLIPLIIMTVIAVVIAVGGLLLYIPFAGPILVSGIFFLTLACGFVMTLVLFGTVGGFNLMYPTIAVEGSDSFDAISRSFSYVYARPWRMLFYTVVSVAYGALTYLFLRLFIFIMLSLIHYFETWWLYKHADGAYGHWQAMWPSPQMFSLPYYVDYSALTTGEKIGAGILSFWIYLSISMLGAFAISFYFSANTIIYYLMRQEVDATELDDVFIEQSDEEFAEAPAAEAPTTTSATHTPPQTMPGPQTDNPPGETLTYSAPSDAPPVESATDDPAATKKPDNGPSPFG